MKSNLFKLIVFLFPVFGLCSCSDEYEISGSEVKEGQPVIARLDVVPSEFDKIQTKVADDFVSDLYVLLFDEEENKKDSFYFTGLSGLSGKISLKTTSGKRYIYGIANLQTSGLSISKETLDGIKNLQELKAVMISLNGKTVGSADGKFLMSGCWTNSNDAVTAGLCNINTDGTITPSVQKAGDTGYALKLKRLQSRITFNVTFSGENVQSFKITEVDLKMIPQASSLIEDETGTTGSGYFEVSKLATNAGNKSFTFYMLENRQSIKKEYPATSDPSANYELREKKNADNWVHAPDNATYVIVKGHYKGKARKYTTDENGNRVPQEGPLQEVDADVTYYVHLGYVKNDATDFSSLRNKDYTYNMNITGVNSIVLEVEENKDYPRGDGDVYYADGDNVIMVDAHYAQKVLEFSYEKLGASNLNIAVKIKSNKTFGFEEKDQEWLRFVENPEGEKRTVSFPGINSDKLLTVTQFVDRLKAFKENTGNAGKTIRFTCFINEYYPIGSDTDWKNYINLQEDRFAQIICRTENGNGSNTIDAAYIIRQHPILSFYNIDKVSRAWGVEWINETTDRQKIGNHDIEIGRPYGKPAGISANSYEDGRANMISELGTNRTWYALNSSLPKDEIAYRDYRGDLEKAYAACMQRNRDENGDGVIGEDEIKWYLPALYQYTDMSIGMNALPQDVQLYSSDDYNVSFDESGGKYWMFKHFISNTEKKVFWAEEGGPYSNLQTGDSDWENYISREAKAQNGARQFRCIRNLGRIDAFDDFVTYNNNEMDLSRVSDDALRRDFLSVGELKRHDERDVLSRPYKKFQVAENTCGTLKVKTTYRFVGWGRGSYALSDKNGHYCKSNSAGQLSYNVPGKLLEVGKYCGTYGKNGNWMGRQGNGGAYVIPDQNGYYIKYSAKGEGIDTYGNGTPDTYYNVGKGNGIYEADNEYEMQGNKGVDYGWTSQNKQADDNGTSACSYYSEEPDGSDLGTWRLPNMRELLLIVNRSGYKGASIMSRTYYSFYLADMSKSGVTQDKNGSLTVNGGSAYSIYSPGNNNSREGYAYNTSFVFLMDPSDNGYKVRCVRDLK